MSEFLDAAAKMYRQIRESSEDTAVTENLLAALITLIREQLISDPEKAMLLIEKISQEIRNDIPEKPEEITQKIIKGRNEIDNLIKKLDDILGS